MTDLTQTDLYNYCKHLVEQDLANCMRQKRKHTAYSLLTKRAVLILSNQNPELCKCLTKHTGLSAAGIRYWKRTIRLYQADLDEVEYEFVKYMKSISKPEEIQEEEELTYTEMQSILADLICKLEGFMEAIDNMRRLGLSSGVRGAKAFKKLLAESEWFE